MARKDLCRHLTFLFSVFMVVPWIHHVVGQTDENLARIARTMGDLRHVLGPNYSAFCAVYWRYLLLRCDIIESKFAEDMENGRIARFCNHVERCPRLYSSQSCMVQLTVTSIRLACCDEPTIDANQETPVSTQSSQEPRVPIIPLDGFEQFDPVAQSTCNFGRVMPSRKIVGGTTARRGEFPWMAMLLQDGVFLCGCNILDRTHMVTAAHCFDRYTEDSNYSILAGKFISDVKETEVNQQLVSVSEHVVHAEYDDYLKWNDIAVVEVSTPLNWTSYVMPACLPATNDSMDTYCTVAGWGVLEDQRPSTVLMKTSLQTYSRDECVSEFVTSDNSRLEGYLHPGVICAANGQNGGLDACKGDSGGPLMCIQSTDNSTAYFVYGIVSNGRDCGKPGEPGLYTDVAFYVNWINDTITTMVSNRHQDQPH